MGLDMGKKRNLAYEGPLPDSKPSKMEDFFGQLSPFLLSNKPDVLLNDVPATSTYKIWGDKKVNNANSVNHDDKDDLL